MNIEEEIIGIKKELQSIKDEMKSFLRKESKIEVNQRDFAKMVKGLKILESSCDTCEEDQSSSALKMQENQQR